MNDLRTNGEEPVQNSTMHLSEWTLEQLVEEMLPEPERRDALAHVEQCARCSAELDAYRSLFTALAGLPRFAPEPGFSDAVLARIQVAPQTSPALERLRHWLPTTPRGWMLLSVALILPALPVVAGLVWLLSSPLISAVEIWQWTALNATAAARAVAGAAVRWDAVVGLVALARTGYAALLALPVEVLVAAVVVLAVGIPLSAWSLVRLVRTPIGNVTYAN